MNVKEARALVDSCEKLDPNYAKAVEICIKDDKREAKADKEEKVK